MVTYYRNILQIISSTFPAAENPMDFIYDKYSVELQTIGLPAESQV